MMVQTDEELNEEYDVGGLGDIETEKFNQHTNESDIRLDEKHHVDEQIDNSPTRVYPNQAALSIPVRDKLVKHATSSTPGLEEVDLSSDDSPPPLLPSSVEEPEVRIPTPSLDNPETLFNAARCGNFHELLSLLKASPDKWAYVINLRDQDGHSLLHWAALFNAVDFIRLSANACGDLSSWINTRSNNGQTPIMWAVIKGHVETMNVLFNEFGANLTCVDSLKADCAILAVQHHQYNAVLLIHKWLPGTSPFDKRDSSGCSSVHWAAYKGDLLMLRLLHYLKADMNAIDNQGMSPIHRATGEGWAEAALFLMEKCGANTKLVNNKNETPIDVAKRLGNKSLQYALSRNPDEMKEETGGNWILSAIYCVVLSVTVISFFNDLYAESSSVFRIVFVSVVVCLIYSFSDLLISDPGFVEKRSYGRSAVEDLQAKLESPKGIVGPDEGLQRICVTCWESKDIEKRMKHCSVCDRCVESFDHHCGWINNCVAEKNHREFIVMVFSTWLGIAMYIYMSINQAVYSRLPSLIDFLWNKPFIFPLWIVYLVVFPWLTILLGAQIRSIAINMNTNELMNMHRYAHFWEGPLNVIAHHHEHTGSCNHGDSHGGRRFKNPFDQGGIFANCMYFWFRRGAKKYKKLPQNEIEMAHVV